MDIQITTQSIRTVPCDALIVGVLKKPQGQGIQLTASATTVDELLNGFIKERCTDGELKGNLGELLTVHPRGQLAATRVLVVGLGPQARFDTQAVRHASALVARHLQQTGARHIVFALDATDENFSLKQVVQAQIEGALSGLYTFRHYQHSEDDSKGITQIKVCTTEGQKGDVEQASITGQILANATNFARDLVNEPPNVLTPTELANRAQQMANEVGLVSEVFDKEKITALGMGGLLAVSQGSAQEPRFIILRYQGAPETAQQLALVGKGITFDTGGISLKPAEHMDEMKGDMGGAAAVLGAMQAIGQLKPHINVTALVPTCENMPSGTAYRPGDIIRMFNGKTIEIVNTDAEGRLILADALAYATREGYAPIIDLATLTGGVVVALGNAMTGLFCNDESLSNAILTAGRLAGEKYWPMPLDDVYNDPIKSDVADIKQSGGRAASSVTAAKILEHFVGTSPWAHLDIAGTSYLDSRKPYQEKGGTGVGVRTLAELVLQRAQQ